MSEEREFGWTQPGGAYPPYVNFKLIGDVVRVTVRGASPNGGLTTGETTIVDMPRADFDTMALEIVM